MLRLKTRILNVITKQMLIDYLKLKKWKRLVGKKGDKRIKFTHEFDSRTVTIEMERIGPISKPCRRTAVGFLGNCHNLADCEVLRDILFFHNTDRTYLIYNSLQELLEEV